jgi:hypothetical protein
MKTCGDCSYAHTAKQPDGSIDFTKRTCYGLPPSVILAPGPGGRPVPVGIRNTVDVKDPQCSLFRNKIVLDLVVADATIG